MQRVEGKVALITGSPRGIGRGCELALAGAGGVCEVLKQAVALAKKKAAPMEWGRP